MAGLVCFAAASYLAVGCGDKDLPPPNAEPSTIDEVLAPVFEKAGLSIVEASSREICRRLSADFLGRFATADEVSSDCVGKTPEEIAAAFQSRAEYVRVSMRHWRDQFDSNDTVINYRHVGALYDFVERLHKDELRYDEFAIEVLADPGFMLQEAEPIERASRVHRVFLGSQPTEAIATDLSALTRVWEPQQESENTISVNFDTIRAFIVPGRCSVLGRCETSLLAGGVMEFETGSFPFAPIRFELLNEAQVEALRGLGRLIVRQPGFYEAQADAILDRLLGWNDGGPLPRRPGTLFPRVRALVAKHLRETGSVASTERLVVASVLYRQTGRTSTLRAADQVVDERPVWATGPVRYTPTEVFLDTVGFDGACDPRYPDHTYFEKHFSTAGSADDVAPYEEFFAQLVERTGHWAPVVKQDKIVGDGVISLSVLDKSYRDMARLFGGCPGSASPRADGAQGLAYAYGNELAVRGVCDAIDLGDPNRPVETIAAGLAISLLGRDLLATEQAAFAQLVCTDCDVTARARGVCVALLGSNEMLLY